MTSTIEFNVNLHKLLCLENNDDAEDDVCLISNNKLEKNPITLYCGHKFNYEFIFKEIKQQKCNNSNNYLETQKLTFKQIKCPYCRTIQNGLLPNRDNFPQIQCVNWPPKYHFLPNVCSYTFVSVKKRKLNVIKDVQKCIARIMKE